MTKIKSLFVGIALIGLTLILSSWGSTGHYKINTASGLSFNTEMAQFNDWISILADHASDADIRKAWDPNEGPKHYIDIDNYPEFLNTGRIPSTLDSVVAAHGATFVYDNGILPWATIRSFDSLQACFERADWDKAVLFAADLGHYVADGHMPMHITRNYNGQYSGNTGIHSRYESTMVNAYISQFVYEGSDVEVVEDVNSYVFSYLYANYPYVDSVLAADDYARAIAGNTSSTAYRQALWAKTQNFTISLFSSASHKLAELIYTAWVNAGSPDMSASSLSDQLVAAGQLKAASPNPFVASTKISFHIDSPTNAQLMVYDLNGRLLETLATGDFTPGDYQAEWWPANIEPGLYLLVLQTESGTDYQKILRTR